MKLGLGLYRDMLDKEHYLFAKQSGCTHIVVHLENYYGDNEIVKATDEYSSYGFSRPHDPIWSYESLLSLKKEIESFGLTLEAIENFAVADWYDILLGGPKREDQIEYLKQIIKNVGQAGIPIIGYNFSIAGVWGHSRLAVARGEAVSACFREENAYKEAPIQKGSVWNMEYATNSQPEILEETSKEELWSRLSYFLKKVLPTAEKYNVKLALHPDDPPMEFLRGQPRLVYQPQLYKKVFDLTPSTHSVAEFCMGSIQEMTEGDIYEYIQKYGSNNKIGYVHFRNVVGKVPHYNEVFIDEGDIDMIKALRILKSTNFNGVLIPDHTPEMGTKAPWYTGMAYALGYMKCALRCVDAEYNKQ